MSRQTRGAARAVTPAKQAVRPRPRRDLRWIAAGVAAIALGGVGASTLYTQATQAHPVVRVNRTIARGEKIAATDLSVVTVGSVAGISTVPAGEIDRLVGKSARTDIVGGALLAQGQLGEPEIAPGTVHLGLKLAPGRIPSQSLPVGAKVRLVAVPATGQNAAASQASQAPEATYAGTVVGSPKQQPDGTWAIDVAVASADGPRLARLAATDQLALVRESDR